MGEVAVLVPAPVSVPAPVPVAPPEGSRSWVAELRWMVGLVVVGFLAWQHIFSPEVSALLLAPALLLRSGDLSGLSRGTGRGGAAAAAVGVLVPFVGLLRRSAGGV